MTETSLAKYIRLCFRALQELKDEVSELTRTVNSLKRDGGESFARIENTLDGITAKMGVETLELNRIVDLDDGSDASDDSDSLPIGVKRKADSPTSVSKRFGMELFDLTRLNVPRQQLTLAEASKPRDLPCWACPTTITHPVDVVTLPCAHTFHSACCAATVSKCPYCKVKVVTK